VTSGRSETVGLIAALTDKLNLGQKTNVTNKFFTQTDPYRNPEFDYPPLIIRGYFTSSSTVMGYEKHLSAALNDWISKNVQQYAKSDSFLENHQDYQVMHVRRGDFLHHKETLGVLSLDYYKQVRNYEMPLAVVTDSPDVLPEFLSAFRPDIMLHLGNSTIFDSLNVIRNASSVVLSNSTFAWWGGFLASLNGAEVFLPSPFYKNDALVGDAFTSEYFQTLLSKFS
jgi:hypothetical protein